MTFLTDALLILDVFKKAKLLSLGEKEASIGLSLPLTSILVGIPISPDERKFDEEYLLSIFLEDLTRSHYKSFTGEGQKTGICFYLAFPHFRLANN